MSRRPYSVAAVSDEFERGVQRHPRVRTRRIQVSSARLVNSRQDAMWSIGCRSKRYFDEMSVGGQVPSHTSRPENDRPVGDLPRSNRQSSTRDLHIIRRPAK